MRTNNKMTNRSIFDIFDKIKNTTMTTPTIIPSKIPTITEDIMIDKFNIKTILDKVQMVEWFVIIIAIQLTIIIFHKIFKICKKAYDMHTEKNNQKPCK